MPAQKVGEDTPPAPAVPADATAAVPAAEEGEQAKEPLAPIPERMTDQTKSKILAQIEFYFSESNLPKDKFLRELVSKDEDGKVEVAILCFFNNIRKLLKPYLKGTDLKIPPAAGGALKHKAEVPAEICQAIVACLKDSASLETIANEEHPGASKVGPKPEQRITSDDYERVPAEVDARSLLAKPFAMDVKRNPNGLLKLKSFFEQHTGKDVKSVRLLDKKITPHTAPIPPKAIRMAVALLKMDGLTAVSSNSASIKVPCDALLFEGSKPTTQIQFRVMGRTVWCCWRFPA